LTTGLEKGSSSPLEPVVNTGDVDAIWTRNGVPDIPRISRTRLFRLLRAMPKGALLHAHFPAMVNWDLFLGEALDAPQLRGKVYYLRHPNALRAFVTKDPWMRRNPEMRVWSAPSNFARDSLTVFPDPTVPVPPGWVPLDRGTAASIARKMASSHSWGALTRNNALPWSLVKHVDGFPLYFRLLLEQAIADGVQHVELKTNLGNTYVKYGGNGHHYEGRWMSPQDEIDAMLRVYEDPRFDFQRRITFRLILGAHRTAPPVTLDKRFDAFLQVYRANPGVVRGVDIFGHEEGGNKNRAYMNTLKNLASRVAGNEQSGFVFSVHSGETAFVEYPVDDNLLTLTQLDASVRVGHGLSLWKSPKLRDAFAASGKHVEISPLSNVILGHVDRVSNHPGLHYYLSDISISINSDDPAYFGYDFVSYDWFMAVLAWKLQLQDVVRICEASIAASALSQPEKAALFDAYNERLLAFVKDMKKTYVHATASSAVPRTMGGRSGGQRTKKKRSSSPKTSKGKQTTSRRYRLL